MKARILTFSSQGDTTLLEYDPATTDMEEVNRVIAEYEAKTGAQPFDMATGERVEKITRKQNDIFAPHCLPHGCETNGKSLYPQCRQDNIPCA